MIFRIFVDVNLNINFIYRAHRLHSASNRLLISLLSADFLLLLNCYIAVFQAMMGAPVLGTYGKIFQYVTRISSLLVFKRSLWFISQVLKQFILNLIKGCQTSGFLGSIAALSQIWSIAAVAFDRFKGIHYPLDAQKRTTNAQVFLFSLVFLFLALVFYLTH